MTSTAISSFSPFAFGKTANPTILPVELLSFDVIKNENTVDLNWITLSEIDNDYFEVQRTSIKGDWETVGIVRGNGTTTEINEYRFSDDNPIEGASYYRFRQVDFNGEYEYSMVRSVQFDNSAKVSIDVYPNPSNTVMTIKGVSEYDIVRVFNIVGQEMITPTHSISSNEQSIDVSSLSNGTYLIYVNGDLTKFVKDNGLNL